MKQDGRTDPVLQRSCTDSTRQIFVEGMDGLLDLAAISLDINQVKRQRWLLDVAQHVVEERLGIGRAGRQDPRHYVAERPRRRKGSRRCRYRAPNLDPENTQRDMVDHDVVHDHREVPRIAIGVSRDKCGQQRRLRQGQSHAAAIGEISQAFDRLTPAEIAHFMDDHLGAATNHLHRMRQSFPQHQRSQRVVTVDGRLQGGQDPIEPLAPVDGHDPSDLVRATASSPAS